MERQGQAAQMWAAVCLAFPSHMDFLRHLWHFLMLQLAITKSTHSALCGVLSGGCVRELLA